MIRALAGLLLAAVSAAAIAQAPANAPVRIRGAIEKMDGQTMMVKTRDGQSVRVRLADNYTVMGISKAAIADLGAGKYIGTTTVGERDGALVALEVHIFPENMRGTGEGHRDMDQRQASKMTNANVADIVNMGKDRVLTVKYQGGEKKILVTQSTVVVWYAPTERGELRPGAPVYVVAQRSPDGSLSAPRVSVGLGGQVPPM
jgi:hypothetical protein